MICNNCGNVLPDGAKFCSVCGAPVNSDPASSYNYGAPVNPQYPDSLSGRTYTDLNRLEAEMSGGKPARSRKSVTKGAIIAIVAVLVIAAAVVFIAATGVLTTNTAPVADDTASRVVGEWTGDKLYMGEYPIDASLFDFGMQISRDGTFELTEFGESGTGTYRYNCTATDNEGEEYQLYDVDYEDAQSEGYSLNLMYYSRFNGGGEYAVLVFGDDLMIGFVRAD